MRYGKDSLYHRHRFSPAIIRHGVRLYDWLPLSYQDIELKMTELELTISNEIIRYRYLKCGIEYAKMLNITKSWGDSWNLDEAFSDIGGKMMCL